MAGCKSADDCRIATRVEMLEDILPDIQEKQQRTHDTTLRMDMRQEALFGKFDEYITMNDKQHEIFFNRTRWGVTWKGLGVTLGGIIAAVASIVGILKYFGG